ncbi:MAG: hypothetical protein RIG62_27605 [Cyclobacteriaceae bacterium]
MKARNLAITKFIVAGVLLVFSGAFFMQSPKPFPELIFGIAGFMLILAMFAIYTGMQALRDAKEGLNVEDELSKKISEKAAAKAYKYSVILWLVILSLLLDQLPLNSLETVKAAKIVVVSGMSAMVLIFLFMRLYYQKVGIGDHEN